MLSIVYLYCIFVTKIINWLLKLVQLILIIFSIVFNEIVIEFVFSDDHKVSILDSSAEEKTEKEKTELEGETESDFVNESVSCLFDLNNKLVVDLDRNISNVNNPFLEIHSPPPDKVFV